MKKLHIHIGVENIPESVKFYNILFNEQPLVEHDDYAKWDLKEPAVNFAISNKSQTKGVNHLGIQVESSEELKGISDQLKAAKITTEEQKNEACCYSYSDKHWAVDPSGVPWETFHTLSEAPIFGGVKNQDSVDEACCIPGFDFTKYTGGKAPKFQGE